ncbi:hypothetical protein [Actinoalloteichus caeruleus]|uniref:NmrA-like domain-containing protein n=1 Tax=Actinoalloteichus caeruleus DSM 43889 TaxID=1120930 RepID=A0ABT1JM89_ACTCY|nr:hypothetical protein [Actinoalloteichus caeruleus]MCP2333238.1 hypothetical protein [Actinoalloteichus caeruleus DSM 43889]
MVPPLRRSPLVGWPVARGHATALVRPSECAADSDLEWTALIPGEFMSNLLEWAETLRERGYVTEPFPDVRSAIVHEADIAAVAATALVQGGHGGREYWVTGPEALTVHDKVRTISDVLGREIRYVEQTREEAVAGWRAAGFTQEHIEFFLEMRTNPPRQGAVPQPTVEEVTGHPPRAFERWVRENAAAFGG